MGKFRLEIHSRGVVPAQLIGSHVRDAVQASQRVCEWHVRAALLYCRKRYRSHSTGPSKARCNTGQELIPKSHLFVRKAVGSSRASGERMGKSKVAQLAYNTNLRADIETVVGDKPKARVHSKEWFKIMNGDPVEINPSVGHGYKIMTVEEWASRWKRNDDFPDCLQCGSTNTKEHHFIQTWCRGKKKWESELLCIDCFAFSWRSYSDPDFKTPEEYEREKWEAMMGIEAH